MNDKNISFKILPPAQYLNYDYYIEGDKKYLLFRPFLNESPVVWFWTKWPPYLLVPEDNSPIISQIKGRKDNDLFSTSLDNLKFKPDFLTFDEASLDGLIIKDNKRVQKISNHQPLYPEFAFKVIKRSEFKEMKGYKPENKILELEIEPLEVGIEGLPKITKIQFYFFSQDPPHISPVDRQLNREKYEKLFWDAEGKEFIIKTKKLIFADRQTAKIGRSLIYDTLSFSLEGDIEEIKKKSVENNQQQLPSQLNSQLAKENSEAEKKQELSTSAKIWIGAGIVLIISGLITVFWLMKRKKNGKRK